MAKLFVSSPSLVSIACLNVPFTDFEVTDPLENVTWPLPRNWAGSISTRTVGSENNTAFFWGFEKTNGSLTDTNSTEPWMIFLAGGPGYSSIASMLVENIGPIAVTKDSLGPNNNSWHNIADIVSALCSQPFRPLRRPSSLWITPLAPVTPPSAGAATLLIRNRSPLTSCVLIPSLRSMLAF
jgi:hypothetical protein